MIPYGKMFSAGQVIIVYVDDEPGFFARVERVQPDRKKGWWQLTFLMLAIPLKSMSWVLDDEQMRGQPFTMNEVAMQIKQVEAPEEDYFRDAETKTAKDKEDLNGGNVISMFEEDQFSKFADIQMNGHNFFL